jgi:hypothetical protein
MAGNLLDLCRPPELGLEWEVEMSYGNVTTQGLLALFWRPSAAREQSMVAQISKSSTAAWVGPVLAALLTALPACSAGRGSTSQAFAASGGDAATAGVGGSNLIVPELPQRPKRDPTQLFTAAASGMVTRRRANRDHACAAWLVQSRSRSQLGHLVGECRPDLSDVARSRARQGCTPEVDAGDSPCGS